MVWFGLVESVWDNLEYHVWCFDGFLLISERRLWFIQILLVTDEQ